ncbi:hypothetical protein NL676_039254 [Syzygium grande]|nr:hypothetical protein NL676_039254 [Syzygium grande]
METTQNGQAKDKAAAVHDGLISGHEWLDCLLRNSLIFGYESLDDLLREHLHPRSVSGLGLSLHLVS